jgi:hypothetical protein
MARFETITPTHTLPGNGDDRQAEILSAAPDQQTLEAVADYELFWEQNEVHA